jgi:thioredoxin 1
MCIRLMIRKTYNKYLLLLFINLVTENLSLSFTGIVVSSFSIRISRRYGRCFRRCSLDTSHSSIVPLGKEHTTNISPFNFLRHKYPLQKSLVVLASTGSDGKVTTITEQEADEDVPTQTISSDVTTNQPSITMRVKELKVKLDEWNVDYADCFDKESLLARYNDALVGVQKLRSTVSVSNETCVENASSTNATSNTIADDRNDQKLMELDHEDILRNIRTMSVKELRTELGQRRISRAGLLEKEDLIQAVYQAQVAAQSFSVTGLLQPGLVTDVTGEQLLQEVQNNATETKVTVVPLLVDVYATWCGPCQLMSKQLQDTAMELGSTLRIVKLDSDQHSGVASQLRVQGLPTLILFDTTGKEIDRIEGALMKDQLIKWIQSKI